MKTILALSILLAILQVSPFPASKNEIVSDVYIESQPDAGIKHILLDTSLLFTDYASLNAYKKNMHSKLALYLSAKNKTINDPEKRKFLRDSIFYLNAALEQVLLFKTLMSSEKTLTTMVTLKQFLLPARLISYEKILGLFNMYPNNVRNSIEGKEALSRIKSYMGGNAQKIDKEGTLDQAFFKSLNGQIISAKNILKVGKHEYTILIFGASWCGPCRFESRHLSKIFHTIDTTKIKVVSVSIDDDLSAWRKSVKDDNHTWMSLLLDGGAKSTFFKQNVPGGLIPCNILIGKEGEIIKKGNDLNSMLESVANATYSPKK